ncbi:PfkB family carbohydrate kinase [Sinorhizobium meliloti]|uniref:PfkB family carbohydrate kinase n=1 Tax=Rhizobium meliloti TaxID=382 RepID=UPI000300EF81|nr:PfkB family carbohydrate kinase [Sinorhizobium meliloti]ASP94474.1 ribokinase [Sinorhizobium meliloti]MDE3822205.1 bifunctional hydroxymethylpyrimidine kinase/phosphomethylpyrimidine kinase [Sinorhizobium meliloti]MDE4603136.1 PfkB family carbohydrate kinase [Sinorhizobium meliloti]MQX57976.1 ribokinase [Sinorhizobium meliloti]RVM43140.1 ribokinase [Sinorhizobium meliloti]
MTIHVVGNVCVDTSFRLERLPRPGETLNATVAGEGVGGKGANQAVAAARTGASVMLWAAAGRDAASEWVESRIAAEVPGLRLCRLDFPCDRSVILVDRSGENVIVTAAACAAAFDPLAMTSLGETWTDSDMLLMQGNLRPEATVACLSAARAAGIYSVFNPSPLPTQSLDLSAVSLIVVNRPEAEALTGEADDERAARRMLASGAGSAIVTLGDAGALLLETAHAPAIRLPAAKIDALDASGAGDCFAGTLAGLLAQGASLSSAAKIATAAAGHAVGRAGTLASFPSRAEIASLKKTTKLEDV